MTTSQDNDSNGLKRDFDIVLEQNHRLTKENELLRAELRRYPGGVLQIRSVERSLASAYRPVNHIDANPPSSSWGEMGYRLSPETE